MTAGVLCVEGDKTFQTCAWPARVATWLRGFGDNVSYVNLARAGTTSTGRAGPQQWGEVLVLYATSGELRRPRP